MLLKLMKYQNYYKILGIHAVQRQMKLKSGIGN